MAGADITIEILKEIRETTRGTSSRLESMEVSFNRRLDVTNERLDIVTERLDVMSERLDLVETTLLDVVRRAGRRHATFEFSRGSSASWDRA
jgi:hypothetical protein